MKQDDQEWRDEMAKEHLPETIKEMHMDNIRCYNGKNRNVTIGKASLSDILISMLNEHTPNTIKCDNNYGSNLLYAYSQEKFDIPYQSDAKLDVKLLHSTSTKIRFPHIIDGHTDSYLLNIKDKTKILGIWIPRGKINIRIDYNRGITDIEKSKGIQEYNPEQFSKQFQEYIRKYNEKR